MSQDNGSGFSFSVVIVDGLVDCRVHQNREGQGILGYQCGHEDCTGWYSMGSKSQVWVENFLQAQIDMGKSLPEAINAYWQGVAAN